MLNALKMKHRLHNLLFDMSVQTLHKYLLLVILIIASILRLPLLDRFPPALYSDEVSQGYNAFSLLETGKDEYDIVWPVAFRSFGDWKPPLPIYLMIPSIYFFGLTPVGVRLSSAIFGTFTVILMFTVIMELIDYLSSDKFGFLRQKKYEISLLGAFLLAISPWHITQSRMAMLTSIALFFLMCGLAFFYKGLKKTRYWLISSLCFVLSIYSYYGMRLVIPLIIIVMFGFYRVRIILRTKKDYLTVLGSFILALLLLLPLGSAYLRQPDVIFGRVKTVSIFHDQGVALRVWDLIAEDGAETSSWLARFFHNKPYEYILDIVRRLFEHVDGRFLFLTGDTHPPFQISGMSVLYLFDLLFIIIGCIFLIKREQKLFMFLLLFIMISILPAALTFVTPAANRTLTLVIPLIFIVSCGVVYFLNRINSGFGKYSLIACILVGYALSFGYFTYQYIFILPRDHADWWHYGYKELVSYLDIQKKSRESISVSGNLSVPYIFFLFYNQVEPVTLRGRLIRDYNDDEFGFEHVSELDNYQFIRYFSWEREKDRLLPGTLLVVKAGEKVGKEAKEIQRILYPDGRVAFIVYEIVSI